MCRAKSDPNYYRCEWRSLTTGEFLNRLSNAAADVGVAFAAGELDPTSAEGLNKIAACARTAVAEGIADELEASSKAECRRKAADEFQCSVSHLPCAVSAAIGEACATFTSFPGDIATAVDKKVQSATDSRIAGKLAAAATRRLLNDVSATLNPWEQVGFLADLAATGFCPSQQHGGTPEDHPEVVSCAARVERTILTGVVDDLLTPAGSVT
ncbi:hypothetical protein [Rothia nasisuis]|uniref:hypothetical protein n=1 Tax=Rothia nasisuis TaxID=2109647 RepID=UPI001F316178|nr:hypothetical protein [Rothia nasisuis]